MVERVREFVDRNAVVRSRLARARDNAPSTETTGDPLPAALEELDVHREELSVAEEELQAQVDELARLSKALGRERARYRDLFENAPDAYFVTDLRGVVVDANTNATRLLGVETKYLRRKLLAAMVLPEHVHVLRDAVVEAKRSSKVTIEVPFGRRDGATVWVELVAHVAPDASRIRWLARDVSARRVETELLANDRDVLERRVVERTLELERALRDKQDVLLRERGLREQLQAANEAKDRFLAILSHDLRGPLNAVLGWTSLLRREPLDMKTRDKALATIERNALTQSELIEELLDVSRIGAGKMQLEMRLVDFGDIARKGIDAVLPIAQQKTIDLVDATTKDAVLVLGDAARLRQIVANLLTNAVKFTQPGGKIVVELTANGTASFRVTDSGKGIAPAVLPYIFDCFKQSNEVSIGKQGLGLGLFIVRHLVEMHGGSVSARSEGEGKGTELLVTLPTRDPETSAVIPESGESSVAVAEHDDAALEGLRILLVDDEEDTRELLATALGRKGAIVVTASDVSSAIETVDAFGPDVMVSDIGLPDADGHQLIARIRSTAAGADLAALAMSGFATAEDATRAIRAGFDAHLRKPFLAKDLFEAIGSVVRSKDS